MALGISPAKLMSSLSIPQWSRNLANSATLLSANRRNDPRIMASSSANLSVLDLLLTAGSLTVHCSVVCRPSPPRVPQNGTVSSSSDDWSRPSGGPFGFGFASGFSGDFSSAERNARDMYFPFCPSFIQLLTQNFSPWIVTSPL